MVTKSKGGLLIEIDGKPALEAYREFAKSRGIELTEANRNQFMIVNELGMVTPDGHKIRARSQSFTDYFGQATLFWNSMASWEQQHIVDAFSFELNTARIGVLFSPSSGTAFDSSSLIAKIRARGPGSNPSILPFRRIG